MDLCDKGVSVLHRFCYFEEVISPVACFGASHGAIHKNDLVKLDVEYRQWMRMVVGPPADTNWASPWHEILHGWNNKVKVLSDYAGLNWMWSIFFFFDFDFAPVCLSAAHLGRRM